ncbi:type IV pilus assembly protein PilM [Anaerohalosphaera lusitana]|uniref:Type IV pilus assembly protein PilM n=1 Tax=Anaerohalosphaera lusitana TaxID=1936003 RepID=A0A1U9NM72_9BACT|nr:type IV pilus assembly protein PilM [Anaerohalosphaera lusitana]AQT68606.1 type IV pilus assembly protein PilM [Anaerohalosphaera lusitana]
MASAVNGVWAIDIGANSLKALHMVQGDEGPEVIDFDYLEHSTMLAGMDLSDEEKSEIAEETLGKFLQRHHIEKEQVAVSIAGQNSFARFIKLPPVEDKKIPEIVRFEAVQQIPFEINEVEWDWQLMENPNSSDTEVGIFAIKNELIDQAMGPFNREGLQVGCVQISPMALYNYLCFDRDDLASGGGKPIVILDMGCENTDLIVCTKDSVWQRTIRMGGNAFTEAVAEKFNLSFKKAEKLKRTAPTSKYIRQIFGAMKPVYTDLGGEVQRSLGFYNSSGGSKGFARVIALGGGMRLKGVDKYLQKTLGVPVTKLESFKKLQLSEEASSAEFHENVSDYGVAYGLGVQALGEAKLDTNLLPKKVARQMAWARKSKFLMVAACMVLAAMILSLAKAAYDNSAYSARSSLRNENERVIREGVDAQSAYEEQVGRDEPLEEKFQEHLSYFKYRDTIPSLLEKIIYCLPNEEHNPEQAELYQAYRAGNVDAIKQVPRDERKVLFVTSVSSDFALSLEDAAFDDDKRPGRRRSDDSGQDQQQQMPFMPGMFGPGMDPGMFGPGGMPGMPGGPGGPGGAAQRRSHGAGEEEEEEEEDSSGFTVVIEGYSPYKDLGEIMDPVGVADDQEKWGFITRLANLTELDPETQFRLFEKGKVSHFSYETGEVDLKSKEMPGGIGIEKEIRRVPLEEEEQDNNLNNRRRWGGRASDRDVVETEEVLVDPLTNEEMSKTFDLYTAEEVANDPDLANRDIGRKKTDRYNGEPKYIVRDHWFRIKAKFEWRDAPEIEVEDK